MYECKVCGDKFKFITWKHLKKHGLTCKEYDEHYEKVPHAQDTSSPEKSAKVSETNKKAYAEGNREVWNKGLTKNDHPSLAKISADRQGENNPVFKIKNKELWKKNIKRGLKDHLKEIKGKTLEERFGIDKALEIKKILSSSAKKRTIHGHTGHRHSEETKNRLRENTVQMIKDGKFSKVSKLQRKFFNYIVENIKDYQVILEYSFKYYTIDIGIPELKLAIEVDGDFWHANEAKGFKVKYDVQKRNCNNDRRKNSFIVNRGWNLLRIWESEIEDSIENSFEKVNSILLELKNDAR